jgi:hypothetical protein
MVKVPPNFSEAGGPHGTDKFQFTLGSCALRSAPGLSPAAEPSLPSPPLADFFYVPVFTSCFIEPVRWVQGCG